MYLSRQSPYRTWPPCTSSDSHERRTSPYVLWQVSLPHISGPGVVSDRPGGFGRGRTERSGRRSPSTVIKGEPIRQLGRSTPGSCQALNVRPEHSDLAEAPRNDPASLAIITSQPNRSRHRRGRVLCVSDVGKWEANYQFRFVDSLGAAPARRHPRSRWVNGAS
jgi:hypothetical protein